MPIYFAWFTTALLSVGGDANDQNLPQSGGLLYCVIIPVLGSYHPAGSAMTTIVRTFVLVGIAFCCGRVAMGQTLAPRAYVITPTGANAVTLSWSFFDGGLNFNGTVPITGATGTYHIPTLSYYHSFSLFGRSANITGFLPYGVGTFQGSVLGNHQQIYRSGLLDLELRFSVNLMGGKAMSAQEFANWEQKTL